MSSTAMTLSDRIFTNTTVCSTAQWYGPVSVCQKPVFYRNARTNRAGLCHRC